MRFLVLSDIHANWEALEAVLTQAQGSYDQILCCGDIVGYGADPDTVTEWVRENVRHVIRGNHDKACAGLEDLEWFNPVARVSALWTQETTKPENITYLRDLPQGPAYIEGFQIVHGSPLDEDEYVVSESDASQVFPYLDHTLSFFGHTHLQGGFEVHRNGVRQIRRAWWGREELELTPDGYYMINPGSVGQPRDGDARAAYAIYDPEQRLVSYHRAAYDVPGAQRKILQAGLPPVLASRLQKGE
ncbi:MAG: metallophosphoesterase family protein [Acidobacteriaceae bacterium]|nr:metallophosphoesterase family protein [Acidobacteriaceae bacterium]